MREILVLDNRFLTKYEVRQSDSVGGVEAQQVHLSDSGENHTGYCL